jgi:hypothetical protein
MKVRVLHSYYGCDTGCCGHRIEIDGEEVDDSFEFDHFDGLDDPRLKAYVLSKVPVECHDSIDWSSLELEPGGGDWC